MPVNATHVHADQCTFIFFSLRISCQIEPQPLLITYNNRTYWFKKNSKVMTNTNSVGVKRDLMSYSRALAIKLLL